MTYTSYIQNVVGVFQAFGRCLALEDFEVLFQEIVSMFEDRMEVNIIFPDSISASFHFDWIDA
jgi:hypothetical protein